jgi:sortase (surface protein transpeptidase)
MPVDIAGHHVTHMRPFLHLDRVRRGNFVTVSTKACVATYRVTWEGVPGSDWPYDNRGHEKLVASTCLYPYVEGRRHFIVALLVKSKQL